MKIVILGGRSGTSVLYRLLLSAGFDGFGAIEPPGLSSLIMKKPSMEELDEFLNKQDWELMKCPELALVLPQLADLYPNEFIHYIWMKRPIYERVESHINMGWDEDVKDRIFGDENGWKEEMEADFPNIWEYESEEVDYCWFAYMDKCISYFQATNIFEPILEINYDSFNSNFLKEMERVSDFTGIPYSHNIDNWLSIKNVSQQAGSDDWIKKTLSQ